VGPIVLSRVVKEMFLVLDVVIFLSATIDFFIFLVGHQLIKTRTHQNYIN